MFEKRISKLKEIYAKELAQKDVYLKNPESKSAKRGGRIGGAMLIVLGLVFAFANYILFVQTGRIHTWIIAPMLAFAGLGIYALITGKMPSIK